MWSRALYLLPELPLYFVGSFYTPVVSFYTSVVSWCLVFCSCCLVLCRAVHALCCVVLRCVVLAFCCVGLCCCSCCTCVMLCCLVFCRLGSCCYSCSFLDWIFQNYTSAQVKKLRKVINSESLESSWENIFDRFYLSFKLQASSVLLCYEKTLP